MRIILISLLFLSGLGFCAIKVYGYFADKAKPRPKVESSASSPEAVPAPVAAPAPESFSPSAIPSRIESSALPALEIGSYTFKNRSAPVAPAFLKAQDSRVVVETDPASNSWVWMGSPLFSDQIRRLGEAFDRAQTEMDLEFVLVLVSTDHLKSKGLSIFYEEKASFLDVLSLSGDAGSLRISSGGWSVGLDFQDSNSGVSLLSQPVVRCLDGNAWEFATDTDVPIPRSEFVDGVLRNLVDYRKIGFGLSGVVRIVGNQILLEVEQRNGSVNPGTGTETGNAPIFQDQTLKTTVKLAWWEWSVLGGIQVDKSQSRKGWFRDSLQVTSDYLVIFVRPRLALDVPPRAVPVDPSVKSHPLESIPQGLLPEKGWQDFPDGIKPLALPIGK